jgi:hypothetical protein
MADIQDYLAAARETDESLQTLGGFQKQAWEMGEPAADLIATAICLTGRSIALAIREASVRADYISRDLIGRR